MKSRPTRSLLLALAACFASLSFSGCFNGSNPPIQVQVQTGQSGWTLRSKHFCYGQPALRDDRYSLGSGHEGGSAPGVSVLVREGFVIGHFDRAKSPLWMAMRWTRKDYELSEAAESHERGFRSDDELPRYAQGRATFGRSNRALDRGHMARNKDNTAWGEDNAEMGDLMSNIVPQTPGLNRGPWLAFENEHHSIVSRRETKIDTVWIIAGAVYEQGKIEETTANGTAVPKSVYKIAAWLDESGDLQAMALLFPQDARTKDLRSYLVSIRSIEETTGLDFFPELDRSRQERIERRVPGQLWQKD